MSASLTPETFTAWDDPTAIVRLGHLEFVARTLVEGGMHGQHASPLKGTSVQFAEHRPYSPGDEVRHIDWRASGKTGRYFVKEFEEETNLRTYLIVDSSGSMGYGERTATKFEYARVLAAALGYLLTMQRDAVGLITFDHELRDRFEPSAHPKSFQQILSMLSGRTPGQETSLSKLFLNLLPTLKRRSLLILISDFFDSLESLKSVLQQVRKQQHDLLLIQVIAPEEEEFPFEKPTLFQDLEGTGRRVLVDPHRLRRVYLEQFQTFQQGLREGAANAGCDLIQLKTTDSFQETIGMHLRNRQRRTKWPT